MEIPSSFVDHVFSMEVMREPVSTPDGHTFEREDIVQWIRVSRTNPVTRAPLALTDLTPNRALKGAIDEFLLSNQQVREQIECLQRQRLEAQRQVNSDRDGLRRYICGISRSIMVYPVTAEDGRNYERKNVEMWFMPVFVLACYTAWSCGRIWLVHATQCTQAGSHILPTCYRYLPLVMCPHE